MANFDETAQLAQAFQNADATATALAKHLGAALARMEVQLNRMGQTQVELSEQLRETTAKLEAAEARIKELEGAADKKAEKQPKPN